MEICFKLWRNVGYNLLARPVRHMKVINKQCKALDVVCYRVSMYQMNAGENMCSNNLEKEDIHSGKGPERTQSLKWPRGMC